MFYVKIKQKEDKMAKDAKKVKTKAKINWGWDAPEDRNGKATRTTTKRSTSSRGANSRRSTSSNSSTSRQIKRLGWKAVLIVLMVTLLGVAIGASVCWVMCRNDEFTIIGNDEITLMLKDESEMEYNDRNSYIDEGVKVVSFGRDVSDSVYIETNLKMTEDGAYYADEIGTYYMIYKVDDIKYGKIFTVQRIRLITFVESTPDNVVD